MQRLTLTLILLVIKIYKKIICSSGLSFTDLNNHAYLCDSLPQFLKPVTIPVKFALELVTQFISQ